MSLGKWFPTRTLPLLFILFSLPGETRECHCYDTLPSHLRMDLLQCISTLPQIEQLQGIWNHYGWGIVNNFENENDEICYFYWDKYWTSFSAKNISSLFGHLRRDFREELARQSSDTRQRIKDYSEGRAHCYPAPDNVAYCISSCNQKLSKISDAEIAGNQQIAETESVFYQCLDQTIRACKEFWHQNPLAYYHSGVSHFLHGDTEAAIVDGVEFLKLTQEQSPNDLSNVHLQLGMAYSETLEYDKAIVSLSKAIEVNPENKEAYLERAVAFFETGDFDSALQDYLSSAKKPRSFTQNTSDLFIFSTGINAGIAEGGAQAVREYIPSLLSSLQGIGETLWAFTKEPVQVSADFARAALTCVEFVKNNTPKEVLEVLVPELKQLLADWHQLDPKKRGEATGHIVGKYGVEIFASAGVVSGVKAFRELKRANNLLNFETMAMNQRSKAALVAEATKRAQTRKEILKSANLKIQWDKQGKHIEGHRNFNPKDTKSFFEHSDPQRLVDDFAGKGSKANSIQPGVPGYQEIVNFNEFIGYSVNPETGEKIRTTWGKIHYAKDGVHIVPINPRG